MSFLSNRALNKYHHPAFQELSEKALLAFYSAGKMSTIPAGTVLFHTGDISTDSYLFLSGCAALQNEDGEVARSVMELGQSDYLPANAYNQNGSSSYSLQATSELAVFRFKDSLLLGLDPEIQLQIFRNLERQAARNIAGMMVQQLNIATIRQVRTEEIVEQQKVLLSQYQSSKAIAELLRKIPRLPSYATRLTGMMADQNFSPRDAVDVAKLDPSLTASVLKTVNSAFFGLRHKVMDFQHAFLLLGFNQVHQIIINRGIQSTMPKTPEFQQLQFHSVMVSALSQEIAQTVKLGNPPLLGTLGLLHDIGQSVVMLLKRQQPQLAFFINLLEPDLIGMLLLKEWQIPQDISSALIYQSFPHKISPQAIPVEHRENIAILYLAHLCFDFIQERELDKHSLLFFHDYMKVLNCQAPSVAHFIRQDLGPAMQARGHTLPQVIQNFIRKGQNLSLQQNTAEPLHPLSESYPINGPPSASNPTKTL